MIRKRKLMWLGTVPGILVVAVTIVANTPLWKSEEFRKKMGWCSYGRENHSTYHACDWNRGVIEDAKVALVKAKGLTNGTPVSWQDIAPIITNLQAYGGCQYPGTPPDYLPKCPSDGSYAINPIGYNVVCSHPYHQWYNCMWKTDRSR